MVEQLQRGRERYRQRAWRDAWRALSLADEASALEGRDLELLATAAYLIGRGDDYLSALARAHHAYLDAGERRRAVRWGIAGTIVWAWVLTIPCSALIAAGAWWIGARLF